MKKTRMMAILSSVCFALILMAATPVQANPKKIVLKAVVPWPVNSWMVKALFLDTWLDTVNKEIEKRAPGELEIKMMGGPEAIPSFDQAAAIQKGVVDIGFTVAEYILSVFPEGVAMQLTTVHPWEERKSGSFEFWNDRFMKKMKVVMVSKPLSNEVKFHIYSNKYISKPDLTGQTFRVSPGKRLIAKKLGASIIVTPPGEVYTALERGLMDGYFTVTVSPLDYGWYKVTKYKSEFGFSPPQWLVLVNQGSWNKLPKKLQDVVIEGSKKAEYKAYEAGAKRVKECLAAYEKAGMKWLTFSPADSKTLYRNTRDPVWEHVESKFPQFAADVKNFIPR
jgi:TRAP-type C4-dicarboxylate transport system substrate-binding protein